jgi:hypothetical protein
MGKKTQAVDDHIFYLVGLEYVLPFQAGDGDEVRMFFSIAI